MSDLHGDIMNLPCDPSHSPVGGVNAELAYKYGHRDARHAAAELAAAHEAELSQLKAERDALRLEAGSLRGSCKALGDENKHLKRETKRQSKAIAALTAERDALREDAERYRWLRMADWWDSPLCAVRNPAKQVKPGSDCPSRYRLDAAIDHAMQGEQP